MVTVVRKPVRNRVKNCDFSSPYAIYTTVALLMRFIGALDLVVGQRATFFHVALALLMLVAFGVVHTYLLSPLRALHG